MSGIIIERNNVTDPAVLEARIASVGLNLRTTLQGVLQALPGSPHRPNELAKILCLNKALSSRIAKATRTLDGLASAHLMPGPEALRMLLKAAARKGVDQERIAAAKRAVSEFEKLIRNDVADRAGLNAMIGERLPHAREKFEWSNKQALFKANVNLKGITSNVYLRTYLIHPSQDPERYDYAMILGLLGLRRLRPSALIRVSNVHTEAYFGREGRRSLSGQPLASAPDILLPQFCSVPAPEVVVREAGAALSYILTGDRVGPDSAVDVVLAEIDRGYFNRYQPDGGHRRRGCFAEIDQPARLLVFDMLLHESVWPGREPELAIYDTAFRGLANTNDPERDYDRLDLTESIRSLGAGLAKFRAADVPNYLNALAYVCERMGWDPEVFHGYRCQIQYPIYSSQVCMHVDPPDRPSGQAG